MYRNVVYRVGPDTGWKGEITLYTWDEDGIPEERVYPHKSRLYYERPNGHYKSMYGTLLEKKEFDSIIERSRWIKNNPGIKIFECFHPEREFLIDYFDGEQEKDDFAKHELRTHIIDIEIAVEEEFPLPSNPIYPINVLTVYDNYLDEYHTWIFKHKKWCKPDTDFTIIPDDIDKSVEIPTNVELHVFDDEMEMYMDFLRWFKHNRPDVLTGWNVEDFDIPYLVERIEVFLGETVELLSPVGTIKKEMREQRGFDSRKLYSYKVKGISTLDYLPIYRFKFGANLPSYKLENVAMEELGYGKISYEGSFKQFYRNHFVKFVYYNIIDVKVVKDLDTKLKYIALARNICNIGLSEYESIFRSSPAIIGALCLQAHQMDVKIMTNAGVEPVEASFTGAFVFDVKRGIYHGGTSSLDLNSLYPNLMINLNISPETKIGKIIYRDDDEIMIKFQNGSIKKMHPSKLEELRGKVTISPNGVLYINPKKKVGLMPAFLERLYKKRKEVQARDKVVQDKIEKIKAKLKELSKEKVDIVKPKLAELETLHQNLNNRQHAYKIFLNSIYGQLGNRYFPLFDLDNAEAVTLSGQKVIKESARFLQTYFQKKYKLSDYEAPLAGDTDSLYFDCSPTTQAVLGHLPEKWDDEMIQRVCDELDKDLVKKINANCGRITEQEFMSPLKNIVFKRETFCTEAMFLAKKRNILHVRNDEGIPVDKWKCTGVDIKRNELPGKIKDSLKHIMFTSLVDRWTAGDYAGEIKEVWHKFNELTADDIAFNKGYTTEKKSNGFLKAEKGSLIHARGAIYHNHIIENLKLEDQYDKIQVGDKIRFARVLKTNVYGIDVIAWKDEWPPEFDEIFTIDYQMMFEKVVLAPLKRIIEINNWSRMHPANEVETDIMNL